MTAKAKEQRLEFLKQEKDFLELVLKEAKVAVSRIEDKIETIENEMVEIMTSARKAKPKT